MAGSPEPVITLACVRRVTLSPARIEIDGRPLRTETLFAYAGAFQLTLSSALPDLGAQLHTSYLGHPDVEHTAASHLWIAAGERRLWTVEHEAATLPVTHARRHCLLDHFAVLADQLRSSGTEVLVDVSPYALYQVDLE